MQPQQYPLLHRLFIILLLLGTVVMGILLYLMHRAALHVNSSHMDYMTALTLADELRNDTRTLSCLTIRATSTVVSREAEKTFQDILDRRTGVLARQADTMVAPGRTTPFLDLVDELNVSPMERELFRQTYTIAEALAQVEHEVVRLAGPISMDDMSDPALRDVVRRAMRMVSTPPYLDQAASLQGNLNTLSQSLASRMSVEAAKQDYQMGLLVLSIGAVFFLTVGSLTVLGYLARTRSESHTTRNANRRIYLYIVTLFAVGIFVSMWFIYTDARTSMTAALEKRQSLICHEVYSELRLRATQTLEIAQIMGARPPIRHYVFLENKGRYDPESRAAALEVMSSFSQGYSDSAHTLLLGKDGKVLASTFPAMPLRKTHLLPPESLARLMDNEAFITVIPNPISGEDELVAVAPIHVEASRRSAVMGAVVTIMDRRNSFRVWEGRLAAEENMNIFVLNRDAEIIISSRGLDSNRTNVGTTPVGRLVQEGATGAHYYTDFQGILRIGYFMPLPELGWTVVVSSVYATLTSDVHHMLVRADIFGIVTVLAIIILFSLLMQRMTRSLRLTNERMDDIIDSAGIFTFDLDMRTETFAHNAQWCHIWQYPGPAEAGVKSLAFVLEHMEPDSREVFQGLKAQGLEDAIVHLDFEVHICSGEQRWLRHMGRVQERDAQGKPLRIIGTGFDITAQKNNEASEQWYKRHLEDMVAQRTADLEESRNQAEAASQAKSSFLSTVSHEIRTPMNAIVGFAHIFDRSNLTSHQKEHLEKIKISAATLLGVINDVLDISKIEAGKLELEQTVFNLQSTLDAVCSMVDFAAFEKGLYLRVDVAPDVPDLLCADPKRLSQILLNLMNNAVKFTSQGGVTLTVRMAEPGEIPASTGFQEPGDDDARDVVLFLDVTDTGIGLTQEQIGRLFKPFIQADSSVTRRFGGTGLGLAICKQLVELMGGSIGVFSQPGQGATFHFTLRLRLPNSNAEAQRLLETLAQTDISPEKVADLRSLAGAPVLVVEDNEINQEIATALLEEYGIVVDLANNGAEALQRVLDKRYACIFMDMQMPIMGGLEASQRLRDMGRSAVEGSTLDLAWLDTVPIVAMTANAMAEDRQNCLDAGMNDHIGKPIEPDTLQHCLLRWLTRRS